MVISCGSDIITNSIAHIRGQYIDYRLFPLHSPLIVQDTRPKIVDAPWMITLGGCDIVTNNIAKKGS